MTIDTDEPLARAVVAAIHTGDVAGLRRLLAENPDLATARLGADDSDGMSRTLLHWAASSDDVDVLDALIDAGADLEAPGAVIAGGPPLADARAFGQWRAAHRLVERGAHTTLTDAATLGLLDRVEGYFAGPTRPAQPAVSRAFWGACHGGQQACAELLLSRGADLDWIPGWEDLTPLDAARRGGATELAAWLHERGASSAAELATGQG